MNSLRIKGNMSLKMRVKLRASLGSQSSNHPFRFSPYFANETRLRNQVTRLLRDKTHCEPRSFRCHSSRYDIACVLVGQRGQGVIGDVHCLGNAMLYGLVPFIGTVNLNCTGGNLWLLWKSVWVF